MTRPFSEDVAHNLSDLVKDPSSRRTFLRRSLVGAAMVAPVGLLAACGSPAAPPSGGTTPGTTATTGSGLMFPAAADLKAAFGDIMKAEDDHVTFLVGALKAAARPKPTFKGLDMPDMMTFVATSQVLESVGVGAYLGAAPAIKDKGILAAAASILTVESRHAGFLNVLTGKANPSFDKPMAQADVVKAAGPFIMDLKGGPDPSKPLASDPEILNFALLLEYLEKDFYDMNVPKFFP